MSSDSVALQKVLSNTRSENRTTLAAGSYDWVSQGSAVEENWVLTSGAPLNRIGAYTCLPRVRCY